MFALTFGFLMAFFAASGFEFGLIDALVDHFNTPDESDLSYVTSEELSEGINLDTLINALAEEQAIWTAIKATWSEFVEESFFDGLSDLAW